MTGSSGQVMRMCVIAALGLATAAMFLVSMRGNYLFGYEIGQTPEKRQLFAWANVAADIWKAFGLIALTVLWRNRHKRMALIGGVAWFVCLLSGVNSAIGVYVQDRMVVTGLREAKHATYKDAEKELAELEQKLKGLASHGSTGQIEAAIAAVLTAPVIIDERVRGTIGQRSADCMKIDARTAEACSRVATLREELAAAKERKQLEPRIAALRGQLVEMREVGAAGASDPIGEFYAWATRGLLSVRDVGFGFPLFFALLIEVVSAFGPITIARYAELTRELLAKPDIGVMPAVAGHGRPKPALAVEDKAARVVEWMAARAVPTADASAVSVEALHADYQSWSTQRGMVTMTLEVFADTFDRVREMPELAGKIRKFGNRYYGIRLVTHGSLTGPTGVRADAS
jgi:hypothetical protein